MRRKMRQTVFLLLWLLAATSIRAEWLTVNSIPADAVVNVNDREAGNTPLRIEGRIGEKIVLTVSVESHKSIRIEHEFTGSKTIYLDLYEGIEIDEDSYWLKKTADVSRPVEAVDSPEDSQAEESADTDPSPVADTGTIENPEQEISADTTDAAEDDAVRLAPLQPRINAVLGEVPDPGKLTPPLDTDTSAGEVILDIRIKNSGSVKAVSFMTEVPNEVFKEFLTGWVMLWTFLPASEAGNPVESNLKVKIEYDLGIGEFRFPTYDLVRKVQRPDEIVVQKDLPEPTATAVPEPVADQTVFYTESQVDQKAQVFSSPPVGNIPLEIINLNLKGTAKFSVFIQSDGSVARVEVVESTGSQKLDDYIIPMIMKSYWEPAKKAGDPVGFTKTVSLDFFTTACKFQFPDLDQ